MELPDLPEGWALYTLNRKDDFDGTHWMAYVLREKTGYAYGHGTTPKYAILDAVRQIEDGEYKQFLSGFTSYRAVAERNLISVLGIKPVSVPEEDRRE